MDYIIKDLILVTAVDVSRVLAQTMDFSPKFVRHWLQKAGGENQFKSASKEQQHEHSAERREKERHLKNDLGNHQMNGRFEDN